MKRLFLISFLISLLPSCNQSKENTAQDSLLFNFADSVKIIRSLIETKSVHKILEDAKQEDIDFLINNYSPAELALESEVLNCTMPVLVYFYEKEIQHQDMLLALAQEYKDHLKIVVLDADQFPKISERAEIETYPAIILFDHREEVARLFEADFSKINSYFLAFLSNSFS